MKSLKYVLAVLALAICFGPSASANPERSLHKLKKNFQLSEEQSNKALAIFEKAETETAKVQKGREKKAINRRAMDKIRNEVLTPEQQAKFDTLRAKADADAAAKQKKKKENKLKSSGKGEKNKLIDPADAHLPAWAFEGPPKRRKRHLTNTPLPDGCILSGSLPGPADVNVLWYKRPAVTWTEALPLGNGRFGGMVFGGITNEVIQLNHDTIWTHPGFGALGDVQAKLPDRREHINKMRELIFDGNPFEAHKIYENNILIPGYRIGTYQTMAVLRMKFEHDLTDGVRDYQHRLDMGTGVAATEYKIGNTHYLREVFVLPGSDLMVCHITVRGGGKINMQLTLERDDPTRNAAVNAVKRTAKISSEGSDKITLTDAAGRSSKPSTNPEGVRFTTKVMARTAGGVVSSKNGVLIIKDATEAAIFIAGATDFAPKTPFQRRDADIGAECDAMIQAAGGLPKVAQLQDTAVSHHRGIFGRLAIEVNNINSGAGGLQRPPNQEMDTSERRAKAVERFNGDTTIDRAATSSRASLVKAAGRCDTLLALQLYQYARYLLICSSRGNSMPANLRGLWNDLLAPFWNSDYHFNINAQLNYYFAAQSNLLDSIPPYLEFLDTVRVHGRKVAREMYGARGFKIGHATSGYATVIPSGQAPYAIWETAGAWAVDMVMEYVRFSGDIDYLRREGLGLVEEAALFMLDWMVPHPKTGKLVVGPGVSPENSYYISPEKKAPKASVDMGCAMDQQLAHQVFSDYLEAAALLNHTSPVVDEVRAAMLNLAPTEIAKDGRIREWSQEFRENSPGHRHLSHLYAFYPGNQFTTENAPRMIAAAIKSVEGRTNQVKGGAGMMGWSRAWVGALHGRFRLGDEALGAVGGMIEEQLFPNLLVICNDNIFDIDGNFGVAGIINEMLLQSHAGHVELLPALPTAWKSGKVNGMLARGGFELSFEWAEGALVRGTVKARRASTLRLKYGNRIITTDMAAGEEKPLEILLQSLN